MKMQPPFGQGPRINDPTLAQRQSGFLENGGFSVHFSISLSTEKEFWDVVFTVDR